MIGQNDWPTISGIVTNTSCFNGCDGTINLFVTGIAPFTYEWGSGFGTTQDTSGLCAGDYNVTVADSNNCGISGSFTISAPIALNISTDFTTDISCFGYSDGAAAASAGGGTPPYSFQWSDGQTTDTATGLSVGTYQVSVTDTLGCSASASVAIPDGYHVFVGVIGGPSTGEVNKSATYIVSANFNYSYTWSVQNGIILSGQGTNSIEVTWTSAGTGFIQLISRGQGCADTVSKSVAVIDTAYNCSALFYIYPDTIPHSYFVVNTASGITPLYYSWDWGDGSNPDTVPYPSHTYSSPGFYNICLSITDSVGCTDTYCNPYYLLKTAGELNAMIYVNVISPYFTGIEDVLTLENILLYPNPTDGTVTLKAAGFQADQAKLKLLDALGKKLLELSFEGKELEHGLTIDLAPMNQGLYFLNLQTAEGSIIKKVVKR